MEPIVGIDLGTTYSLIGIVENGRPRLFEWEGRRQLPSVAGFDPDGKLLVGEPARNQFVLRPDHTVRSIKRHMGTDHRVRLNKREYTPQEISAFILGRLKRIAEEALGREVRRAVITVPAYFSDAARRATRDAGEIAGFAVERIINEPTAAALAFGLGRSEEGRRILVYDLGGGTFDVSVVETAAGVTEVLASHGNAQLGGDDFDQKLLEFAAGEFRKATGFDVGKDPRVRARLAVAVEAAKRRLSCEPFTRLQEEFLARKKKKPLHLDQEIERHRFEGLIAGLLEGTLLSVDKALEAASLRPDEIDSVILVGGSTRIPLVRRLVEEKMGRPPVGGVHPDEAVALGAAIQGGIIEGREVGAVLVDVTPHALGIATATDRFGHLIDDVFSVIIQKNTAIPVSKSEVYSTLQDNQDVVQITAYQGENPKASENALLGEFRLEGIEPAPAGEPQIVVTFDYDVDGIVHVTAADRKTGARRRVRCKPSPRRLDEADKERAKREVGALAATQADPRTLALIRRARDRARGDSDPERSGRMAGLADRLEAAVRRGASDEAEGLERDLTELMLGA